MVKLTHSVPMCVPTSAATTTSTDYVKPTAICGFYYDSSKYTNPTFRLEVNGYVASGGTASFILQYATSSDSSTAASNELAGSVITTTSTTSVHLSSSDFTLTNGYRYWVYFKTSSASYTSYIKYAKLTIIDDIGGSAPSTVESYVIIGASASLSNDTYTATSTPCIFKYDSSKYDGTLNVYLETGGYVASSNTGYIHLWNVDDSSEVSGSETSITSTSTLTRVRSGAFSLVNGKTYRIELKSDGTNNVYSRCARLVFQQSGTITKTRTHIGFSAYNTTVSTGYVEPTYPIRHHHFTSEVSSPVASLMVGYYGSTTATLSVELFNNDASSVIQEFSYAYTGGSPYVDIPSITSSLVDHVDYRVKIKTSTGTFYLEGCSLVLDYSFNPTYHAEIPVNYSSDGAQTNYQMKLTINSGTGSNSAGTIYLNSHALNWPYDIQFRNSSGDKLSHWRESYDANTQTVWVKCDSIAASGTTSFDIYYGDADMGDSSDGDAAFEFFDDFPGTAIDTSKWEDGTWPPTKSVSGGALTITGVDTNWNYIGGRTTFGANHAFDYKINSFTLLSTTYGIDNAFMNGYGLGNEASDSYTIIRHKHATLFNYNGSSTTVAISGQTDAAIYTLARFGTTSTGYAKNYGSYTTNTTQVPTTTGDVPSHGVTHQSAAGAETIDWSRVRHITENAPTWATPGSEEGGGTTTYTFTKNSDAFVILQENLKARYDMSTTSSSKLKDLSGYGNDGTAYGGVTIGGAAGISGNCTDFETDDYIDLGSGTSITSFSGNKISLVAWVNPDSLSTAFPIFYCTQYRLNVNTNGQVEVILSLGGTVYTKTFGSAGAVPTGSWTQIAFTFDGTNWDVYINKTHQTTQTQTGTLDSTSNSVKLGRNS